MIRHIGLPAEVETLLSYQETAIHFDELLVQVGGPVAFGDTPVKFKKAFKEPPIVVMALNGFDISNQQNIRIGCGPVPNTITKDGFVARINTWANTGIFAGWAVWIAVGKAEE